MSGSERLEQFRAHNPRVGETWGHPTEGPYLIEMCEPVERFWSWRLFRTERPQPPVLVAYGWDENVLTAWQQACDAYDKAVA